MPIRQDGMLAKTYRRRQDGRWKSMFIHLIEAEDVISDLSGSSKMNGTWASRRSKTFPSDGIKGEVEVC
jgi:hypothetical protein